MLAHGAFLSRTHASASGCAIEQLSESGGVVFCLRIDGRSQDHSLLVWSLRGLCLGVIIFPHRLLSCSIVDAGILSRLDKDVIMLPLSWPVITACSDGNHMHRLRRASQPASVSCFT
jgi:hypothetical protein